MAIQRGDNMPESSPAETGGPELESPTSDALLEAGDLRSVERLLSSLEKPHVDPFRLPRREPVPTPPTQPSGALQSWALQPLPDHPADEERGGFLPWLFLSIGLMAFACGGVM